VRQHYTEQTIRFRWEANFFRNRIKYALKVLLNGRLSWDIKLVTDPEGNIVESKAVAK
jgi:hypothetical protein